MGDRKGLVTWTLVLGFWTLLALSFVLRGALSSMAQDESVSWHRAFAWNLSGFYLWMFLTPLVGWVGRLTAGHGWRRFFSIHIPASIAIAALQAAVWMLIYFPLRGAGSNADISIFGLYRIEYIYAFHISFITYWLLLAVLRGIESQRRFRKEQLRVSRLETQLAQSQLQALRMQLQPHFLFNTLNAISALTLSEPVRARLMITRLGDFLRLTLEEEHLQSVPLSREVQFLECYLAIQRVRFQDRLTTQFDIADNTLNASVPNLLLQPLVENAFSHGLLPKSGTGTLRVVSCRDDQYLYLLLEDNGLGLPEKIHQEGIGLGNTRARLKGLFNEAARLDLTRIATGGTRVELRFPFKEYAA